MRKLFTYLKIIFYSHAFRKNFVIFMKIFVVVFFLVLGSTLTILHVTDERNVTFQTELKNLFNQPRIYNDAIIIENDALHEDSVKQDYINSTNFRKGTALDARYTLPKHGEPKGD